jgi:hypothetical protein
LPGHAPGDSLGRMSVTPAASAPPSVDELLAGPRGRRLCLSLARNVSDELGESVSEVSYALDPEAGRGARGWFVLVGHEEDGLLARFALAIRRRTTAVSIRLKDMYLRIAHLSGHPPRKNRDVDRIARLLDAAPMGSVTAHELDLALREAVDFARYWQQPDGEDVLAARPELRTGLERVARMVLGREDVGDMEAEEDDGPFAPAPLPDPDGDPHATLRAWSARVTAYERRESGPLRPHRHHSGAWWSMPQVPWTVGRLPEGAALAEDADGTTLVAHPVQEPGRTVEVRRPEDWVELCRRFPLEVTRTRLDDWYNATGRVGRWVIPDWSRVADVYDAVHVTVWGYLTTAGQALPVDEDTATVMARTTADGTCWLTRVPTPTAGPTCTITYDEEGDRWVAAVDGA